MTTQAAADLYLAQHQYEMEGVGYAVYNPNDLPLDDLPVIYGFNNGGSNNWYTGVLMAEDGKCLGSHICTHEGYMRHDLGILEGSRLDRHDTFREHYPDGYKMDFVPACDVKEHFGLMQAYELNQINGAKENERMEAD